MDLKEIKKLIESVESKLSEHTFIIAHAFERNGRVLYVALTNRLKKSCKRGRVWKSKAFLTAFKNAEYGFDESRAKSQGGSDGIFLLTRNYLPKNEMMKKIFDRFLDKQNSEAEVIAKELNINITSLLPVRLVSHHMRLLGVLMKGTTEDTLVLIDYDDTK
ncbi:MAG: hypothetical protein PVJ20_14410 [Desulfobacterales bacterium]|jgi:hypothetical protein